MTSAHATTGPRVQGIDVARGLATLAMIQTHAYDAWVRDDARSTLAFRVTRVIATLALPTFLFLAGVSLALRVEQACARAESAATLRAALIRRGLGLVLLAYAYSALGAVFDHGTNLPTLLRADVLHAIGLSVATLAFLGLPRSGDVSPAVLRQLRGRAVVIGLLSWLACPPLSQLGHDLHGPMRFLAAPFVEVPIVTRMPLIPLLGWAAAGAALPLMAASRAAWVGIATAALGGITFYAAVHVAGLPSARTSYAIVPNATELVGRALCMLALGLALVGRIGERAERTLVSLGRHSLLVYALHLPFCYGLMARPFQHTLSMSDATLALVLLTLGCIAVSVLADGYAASRRSQARTTQLGS